MNRPPPRRVYMSNWDPGNSTAIDPSDQVLLERIARADKEALSVLHARYARRVFASAVKHVSDGSVAEEIVQEVFLAVWIGASGYRPERGGLQQWLFTITRNKIQDHWRRVSRLAAALGDANGLGTALRVDVPSERVESRLDTERLLGSLTAEQRLVVELVYFQDCRFQEAAKRLKIPVGTVKSRVHAALVAMRAALDESP